MGLAVMGSFLFSPGLRAQCISQFPYFEDFENGAGGWSSSSIVPVNPGAPNSWTLTLPTNYSIDTAYSGLNAWVTGNSNTNFNLPDWTHFPNEFSAVTSPCFDFTSLQRPALRVAIWWQSEFMADGTALQASLDSGSTWFLVGDYLDPNNWYNDNAIAGNINGGPGGQSIGWSGIDTLGLGSGGYVLALQDLDTLAGQSEVFFRFVFSSNDISDSLSLSDGFAFDDFTISSRPSIELGNDTLICQGDSLVLDVCDPALDSYSWNFSFIDTSCVKTIKQRGGYILTVQDTLGFILRDTIFVDITNVNLGGRYYLCPDDTISLNAGNPLATSYLWAPGGSTAQTIEVSSGGNYSVAVTDSQGCISRDTAQVFDPISTFPYFEDFENGPRGWTAGSIIPGNPNGLSSWVLTEPDNFSIDTAYSGVNAWVTGNSPNNFGLPAWTYFPGEFSAVTSPCFDFSNLQNPGIQMAIWWQSEFSQDGTCLQASTDGGVTWETIGDYIDPVNWYNDSSVNGGIYGGPGGQPLGWSGIDSVSTGPGRYLLAQHALDGLAGEPSVRLRFAFSANSISDSVSLSDGFAFDDILIADMPIVDAGPDTVICFANLFILDVCVPGATSYQWNNNPIDTFCTKVAVRTDQYIVRVVDTLGFIQRDTMNLLVSDTYVNLGSDLGICPGDSVVLNAGNPWGDHLWLPDSVDTQVRSIKKSGTYTAQVSDSLGCLAQDSINVIVDFVPNTDLGADTSICAGETIVLDASQGNPGTTYDWTPVSAFSQTINVAAPGTYTVKVTSPFGCEIGDTVTIRTNPLPSVNLGPDRTVCMPFQLNATNPSASFTWTTGESTPAIQVTQGGTYGVSVTSDSGCTRFDSVVLSEGLFPDPELGPDVVICGGQSVTFTPAGAGPGNTYLWSTNDTTPGITVNYGDEFILRMASADGCEARDTVTVTESPLTVELGPDRTICDGDIITLNAGNSADQYSWSTGQNTQTLVVNTTNEYKVEVRDDQGCVLRDSVNVFVVPAPRPGFSVSGDTVLNGTVDFGDLTQGNPVSWFWEFGDGKSDTVQNPSHVYKSFGSFNVCLTVEDGNCERTECQMLTIALPQDVDEAALGDIRLYPNPSKGSFQLDLKLMEAADVEVEIFDLRGKKVYQEDMGYVLSQRRKINLNTTQKGMFILSLDIGGYQLYRKILIE